VRAKVPISLKKVLVLAGFFVFSVLALSSTIPSETVNAAPCPVGRNYCNSDERRAYDTCMSRPPATRWIQGAIWFNNTGNASTTDGYYALGVNIAADATSVNVNIRGSVYGCATGSSQRGNIYAIEISPDSDGGRYPDSGRLRVVDRTLNRGSWTGGNYQWTRQGSSARAVLNVSGLAMNNANGPASQTINIGLFRCQSDDGRTRSGSCDTAIIPVTVTRAQRPVHELTPTVRLDRTSAEVGQSIAATPTVRATAGARLNNVAWQLTKFTVEPNDTYITSQADNTLAPTAHYGTGSSTLSQGTGNFTGTQTLPVYDDVTEDLPVGSLQCYALSLNPYTNRPGATGWRHGVPTCVVIAKRPLVQVMGGDLIVGRGIGTNPNAVSRVVTSTKLISSTGLNYGSWSEYGIIPSGVVLGMGSGAAYSGGAATNAPCSVSVLTFANNTGSSCDPARVGQYNTLASAPNVASRFTPTAPAPLNGGSVNLNALAPSRVYTSTAATLNVASSAAFGAGRWVVINAPGTTVTITGNLSYVNTPLTSISAIPQIVIIANNIIIADGVTNVDAWLIATGSGTNGRVNTCGAGTGITEATLPNANQCNQKLTVNGPLMANHLIMRRTAGAGVDTQSGEPAEVFNLRADAYLWATSFSAGSGRIPTVDIKELPPRF
jgi:hypothetical protein